MSVMIKVIVAGIAGMMGTVRARCGGQAHLYFKDVPKVEFTRAVCKDESEFEVARRGGFIPTTDLDEALASDWDVFDVCLPNALHFSVAKKAIEAASKTPEKRRLIVIEKPMTAGENASQEARILRDMAKKAGNVILRVNHVYRHVPAVAKARQMILTGEYGRVIEISCAYQQGWGCWPYCDMSWRFEPPFGGTLGDLGSHIVDLAGSLTGLKVTSVIGDAVTHVPARPVPNPNAGFEERFDVDPEKTPREMKPVEVEDACNFLLRYENGARGVMTCTRNEPGKGNGISFNISTEYANFKWSYEESDFLVVTDLRNGLYGGAVKMLCDQPNFAYFNFATGHGNSYEKCYTNFQYENLRALTGLEPISPAATADDALNTELVLDAIRKSWETRAWVDVEYDD
ncbi:MAG: Gfo/Idh/MocA family oxidoreductase [Thermoguttaceae bacterium]|nr:Gfo/Idh/MocA family oxidoreductase [Thermoguttaceae bacterium]MBQ9126628.1 Gfo/Idh/MocA family oxidoreductase [Thermoguttaceae bacterium]